MRLDPRCDSPFEGKTFSHERRLRVDLRPYYRK